MTGTLKLCKKEHSWAGENGPDSQNSRSNNFKVDFSTYKSKTMISEIVYNICESDSPGIATL